MAEAPPGELYASARKFIPSRSCSSPRRSLGIAGPEFRTASADAGRSSTARQAWFHSRDGQPKLWGVAPSTRRRKDRWALGIGVRRYGGDAADREQMETRGGGWNSRQLSAGRLPSPGRSRTPATRGRRRHFKTPGASCRVGRRHLILDQQDRHQSQRWRHRMLGDLDSGL